MTHDPLCDSDDDPYNCHCDLIAKVRADQDRIHREEMQSLVLAARKEMP